MDLDTINSMIAVGGPRLDAALATYTVEQLELARNAAWRSLSEAFDDRDALGCIVFSVAMQGLAIVIRDRLEAAGGAA